MVGPHTLTKLTKLTKLAQHRTGGNEAWIWLHQRKHASQRKRVDWWYEIDVVDDATVALVAIRGNAMVITDMMC